MTLKVEQKKQLKLIQKVGYWIWGFVAFLAVLITMFSWYLAASGTKFSSPDDNTTVGVTIAFAVVFTIYCLADLIISFLSIRNLNQANGQMWAIVLTVVGFVASTVFLIPGIWGLIAWHKINRENDLIG